MELCISDSFNLLKSLKFLFVIYLHKSHQKARIQITRAFLCKLVSLPNSETAYYSFLDAKQERKCRLFTHFFTLIFLPLLEQILHIFAHLPPIQQPLYEHLVASVESELLALKTER